MNTVVICPSGHNPQLSQCLSGFLLFVLTQVPAWTFITPLLSEISSPTAASVGSEPSCMHAAWCRSSLVLPFCQLTLATEMPHPTKGGSAVDLFCSVFQVNFILTSVHK
ncbi:hypothetical protein XENORESO_018853 [Xenotaenia resolanae]|uniref:Uncharacterized protein n=1 Tax=Xenotaenia resolanae TaxID=208358 RepID=A0ABV0WHH8_9TELE